MTGICRCSASLRTASDAPDEIVPPPAQISGFSAAASIRAASVMRCESGASGRGASGSVSSISPISASVSGGISISTGRGRPFFTCWKASWTVSGTSAGSMARRAHLVTVRMISSWSSTSCSIPRLTPIRSRSICPVTIITGDDAA